MGGGELSLGGDVLPLGGVVLHLGGGMLPFLVMCCLWVVVCSLWVVIYCDWSACFWGGDMLPFSRGVHAFGCEWQVECVVRLGHIFSDRTEDLVL